MSGLGFFCRRASIKTSSCPATRETSGNGQVHTESNPNLSPDDGGLPRTPQKAVWTKAKCEMNRFWKYVPTKQTWMEMKFTWCIEGMDA